MDMEHTRFNILRLCMRPRTFWSVSTDVSEDTFALIFCSLILKILWWLSTNPHGGLLYCIHNFNRIEKLGSRTKKCIMFLKWELINSLKLRHENSTIMDINVQVKDVLVKLRSAGNTVKVTKYRKVGCLRHGQTFVGLMRVFIVVAQEGFHIHETVRFLGEGVILWSGFNWLKTGPNVQAVKVIMGIRIAVKLRASSSEWWSGFFQKGQRTGPDKSGEPGSQVPHTFCRCT